MLNLHPTTPPRDRFGRVVAAHFPANAIGAGPRSGPDYVRPPEGGITTIVASFEGLTTPERMVLVMRRFVTDPETDAVTEDDFREAAETCDISPGELRDNIGAAKRLFESDRARRDAEARAEIEIAMLVKIGMTIMPDAAQLRGNWHRAGLDDALIDRHWPTVIARIADQFAHELTTPAGQPEGM